MNDDQNQEITESRESGLYPDVAEKLDRSDYVVRSYQDEVDVDQNKSDPLMNELNDDPVELLGVPAEELRKELDKRDADVVDPDDPENSDDMREETEALDDERE